MHGPEAGGQVLAAGVVVQVGSAELPELLKKQLDVFAEVLRSKKGTARQIKVTGHADASGTPEANQAALDPSGPKPSRNTWLQKGADPNHADDRGPGLEGAGQPGQSARAGKSPASRSVAEAARPQRKRPGSPGRFACLPAARPQGHLLGHLAGEVDLDDPAPHAVQDRVSSSAGWLASSTVGAPGAHGVVVFGMQGMG